MRREGRENGAEIRQGREGLEEIHLANSLTSGGRILKDEKQVGIS